MCDDGNALLPYRPELVRISHSFFVQNYRMCVYCSKQVRGYKMKDNIGLRLLLTAGFKVISQLTNGGWLDVSAV